MYTYPYYLINAHIIPQFKGSVNIFPQFVCIFHIARTLPLFDLFLKNKTKEGQRPSFAVSVVFEIGNVPRLHLCTVALIHCLQSRLLCFR